MNDSSQNTPEEQEEQAVQNKINLSPARLDGESFEEYKNRRLMNKFFMKYRKNLQYLKQMPPSARSALSQRGKIKSRVEVGGKYYHPTRGLTGGQKGIQFEGKTPAARFLMKCMGLKLEDGQGGCSSG